MLRGRRALLAALLAAVVGAAGAEPARAPEEDGKLFDAFAPGRRKEPITVTSDGLEYDYKNNVVVYRGDVVAAQGPVRLRADSLTVTLKGRDGDPKGREGGAEALDESQRVDQIVAGIAPAPLLIAHGTGDWLLGTHHARELFARAADPKSLLLVEGGSHAEGMMIAHPEALGGPLADFLDRHL